MSRITRIAVAALAAFAVAAPVATAMPDRGAVRTSSLAGTASPDVQQDLRSPDARDAAAPGRDLRTADARDAGAPAVPTGRGPVPAVPAADDGDPSVLVYLVPAAFACLLIALVMGAAMRSSGRVGRARA